MDIRVHSDHTLAGHEAMRSMATSVVEAALAPHERHLGVVDVHLSDESAGHRAPADQRCLIEVLLPHQEPAVASHDADSLEQAVRGAAHKLERVLDSRLGQRADHRTHGTPSPHGGHRAH